MFELLLIPLICVILSLNQTPSEAALPSVVLCAPVGQNIMGNTAPAPKYSMLNSSFAVTQCATWLPTRSAEEGKDSTFTLCYLGVLRDLRLLGPCCKFCVVKKCNSMSQPADHQIQVVKLKHKFMKQSFLNLSNGIHRSIKNIQDRAERQSGQESVQRGGNFCALLGTAGEGAGARAAGQEGVQGPCQVQDQLKWTENISAVVHLWKTLHWECSDMLLSGVLCLLFPCVPVSAAVRAQDEDGAEGSTGRTDTSSSVSISNSISSCEVTKIVRMPLACLQSSLLMWFRAFTTHY